jgi:23S rRNA-/tRNA-specific pseudouridylate synthase
LLHRLDKDTSGVVALARTERSRRHFVRQFEDHTIAKRYLAVVKKRAPGWAQPRTAFTFAQVRGHEHVVLDDVAALFSATPQDEFVLCGPLGRDPADRRRCVVIADGQTASTRVRVLGVENGYALLEVQPITGRTHQIRAHLAALGYAIVGDPVYAAGMQENTTLSRQFLHAHSLTLYSYPACAAQTFVAPLADDLLLWLQGHTPALMACAQHYCQAL